VFLLLAGYFYYFEVIRKERKEAKEEEAKKVFQVKADQIQALEIHLSGKPTVLLEKNGEGWRLSKPVESEADQESVRGLLKTLEFLEMERQVIADAQDLEPYGLVEPSLKVRFLADQQWKEISLGDKNPAGGDYYARTDAKKDVFLIDASSWGGLNKGPNDLRRREMFSFDPADVEGMQVIWHDGPSLTIEPGDKADSWRAAGHPEVQIKSSKMNNVLDQLSALRASEFLEERAENLEAYGLDSPDVTISLKLREGNKTELRLGKKLDQKKNVMTALSTELPAVVQVDGRIMDAVPKGMRDLEDRSLLSFNTESITQIKWKLEEDEGELVKMGDDKWGRKRADGKPEALEQQWHVKSLLWELANAEYEQKQSPSQEAPAQPRVSLELLGAEKPGVMAWESPVSEDASQPVPVWIKENGSTQTVEVNPEKLEKIEEKLLELSEDGNGENDPAK
jgi:hypothetical protein